MDDWLNKIKTAEVLVVDLDGTLVNSDQANFLAYQAALLEVTGENLPMPVRPEERFNRNKLQQVMCDQPVQIINAVVQRKEAIYSQFLHTTQLHNRLHQLLLACEDKVLVLATHARQVRAQQLLQQHNLQYLFAECYYYNAAQPNKYQQIFTRFKGKKILIFENEQEQVAHALAVGADLDSIIMVGT